MWILRNSKGDIYYLTTGKEHIVSRKDGDIVLPDDQSISRRHAVISITYDHQYLGDVKHEPVVILKDTNSKYGTFLGADGKEYKKLSSNTREILQNGCNIRFGLQWNEWKLEHLPLVVTTSTLTPEEKKAVQEHILTLGGHIINSWTEEVTHVVMSKITLTVKVVCALAHGKPIVTPQYWQNYVTAVSERQQPPDYLNFLPALAESTLNINEVSFDKNEHRRTLFAGKHVFFTTSRQFNSYACMVTAAGGNAEILDLNRYPNEDLFAPDCIVVQYALDRRSQGSQVPKNFEELTKQLKQNGKRLIPESEIALAILYCSLEKNCNPEFCAAASLVSSKTEANETQQSLLALDTLESMPLSLNYETLVIPESGVVPTQRASGKLSCEKKFEESFTGSKNITCDDSKVVSGRQSIITEHFRDKRGEQSVLKVRDSEQNILSGRAEPSDQEQNVDCMSTETIEKQLNPMLRIVKEERMSIDSDTSVNRSNVQKFSNSSTCNFCFTYCKDEATKEKKRLSKKRSSEESTNIENKVKKIKKHNSNDSAFINDFGNLNEGKADGKKEQSNTSIMSNSNYFSKMENVTDLNSAQKLKQERHNYFDRHNNVQQTLDDPHTSQGIKRKCNFTDDKDSQSFKRNPPAEYSYSNCSTLPVEQFSSLSLHGFLNADAQKGKLSCSNIKDIFTDMSTAEENITLIEFKALVARTNLTVVNNSSTEPHNQAIPNYKKFRKVQNINLQCVPLELDTASSAANEAPEMPNGFISLEPQKESEDENEWTFGETVWNANSETNKVLL